MSHPTPAIRERLKQELSKQGLSAVDLARAAEVKTSFIYDILNGKSANPSPMKLAQVAGALGVSLAWLAGVGSAAARHEGTASPQESPDYALIPRMLVDASAGGGSIVTREEQGEKYYFRRSWIREHLNTRPEHLRLLTVAGDSMEPSLQPGDMILVDTARVSPAPPGIFVLFDGFGLVAKRLEFVSNETPPRLRILSDNSQYSAYERSLAETRIIGRVVWFAREL